MTKVSTGSCTESDDCTSSVCLGDMCCTAACQTSDVTCGASSCDQSGACIYPDPATACGLSQLCLLGIQTNATSCTGTGTCPTPTTILCPPYVCDPRNVACLTSCNGDTDCLAGAFCDIDRSACCTLVSAGTVYVDSVLGDDTVGCCGVGTATPCQTLKRAMVLIDEAKAVNVTIIPTVNGVGGDWAPASEVYPVFLGWGVELNAPDIYFNITSDAGISEIFEVGLYPGGKDNVGYASIVGATGLPVGIGMNAANTTQLTIPSAISIDGDATLYIANATVNSSYALCYNATYAIIVNGTLTLGSDNSGGISGPVQIGNALGVPATNGCVGINCNGGTIQDIMLDGGQSTVTIQGQFRGDIQMAGGCQVNLSGFPVLGLPPAAGSNGTADCPTVMFNGSPNLQDYAAFYVPGGGPGMSITFNNGTIQCTAFGMDVGVASEPATINIDNSLVRNNDIGLTFAGGVATVTNTTVVYNGFGVEIGTDYNGANSTVDLGGGGNTFACSIVGALGYTPDSNLNGPGIDVLNTQEATVNASNSAWSTPAPDYFECDTQNYPGGNEWVAACECLLGGGCVNDAGADGMNAVVSTPNGGDGGFGAITTTGNTTSPFALDAGCI